MSNLTILLLVWVVMGFATSCVVALLVRLWNSKTKSSPRIDWEEDGPVIFFSGILFPATWGLGILLYVVKGTATLIDWLVESYIRRFSQ